jgi:hypothetical protein
LAERPEWFSPALSWEPGQTPIQEASVLSQKYLYP